MIAEALIRARQFSPYLAESMELFPEIRQAITKTSAEELCTKLQLEASGPILSLEEEMSRLRTLKRKTHLVIAVSDISEIWDWVEVTEYLTRLADFCLQRILAAAGREAGIEPVGETSVPGLFILAVGKYGARELNYSSDVDFNVFYDPDKIKVPNPGRAERTLIKLIQSVVKGMESITEDGYIFRTDLRLRPDPRSNAIAVSVHTAERYYATIGQNWERAAMIKARCCAGDFETGQEFIDHVLRPFIWRKNMDYAAIEDILAIKRQIHARAHNRKDLDLAGHNIKLGYGGIREIEFYAQVQQLILGGRHLNLRTPRTVDALSELAQMAFISDKDAQLLTTAYGQLRKAEHVLQMIKDEQTHTIPDDPDNQEKFAGLFGKDAFDQASANILETLQIVRATYAALFPDQDSLSSREGNMVFTGVEPDPDTLGSLSRLGYENKEKVWYEMAAWLGGRIRATRTEKARELLTYLAPQVIEFCADTGQPDKAFERFDRFFSSLAGGVSLLSRFRQKPEHLKYVIDLMTRSELVASWIADRPTVLDALSDPQFLEISEADIVSKMASIHADDFEVGLNETRRAAREIKFKISAALLSARLSPDQAGRLFSICAEGAINALLPLAIKEASRRGGLVTGEIAILGMGKLASRNLNLASDLDIMLIYSPGNEEIDAQRKYAKVTQRLISALSAVTEEGPLYDVDMALRPSGRSGPVAVAKSAFESYYRDKAWSWEFMALTRSRVVAASSEDFASEIETSRVESLACARPDLEMDHDIADMLRRVRREKPARYDLDLKNAEGGIRDIEFIAQKLLLTKRKKLPVSGIDIGAVLDSFQDQLGTSQADFLISAYTFYLAIGQHLSVRGTDITIQQSDWAMGDLADAMHYPNATALAEDIASRKAGIVKLVDQVIFG